HPRKMKARDLSQRSAVARVRGWIVDDHVVPLRLSREVSVHDLRLDPAIFLRVLLEALEHRLELLLHRRVVLLSRSTRTPLKGVQPVGPEEAEDPRQRR